MYTNDLPVEIRREIRRTLKQIVGPPNSKLRQTQLEKLGYDSDTFKKAGAIKATSEKKATPAKKTTPVKKATLTVEATPSESSDKDQGESDGHTTDEN